MQNQCCADLCLALEENTWELAHDVSDVSGGFLAAAKLSWAQCSPQAGSFNNM